MAHLAIKGHATRGKEVIEILEMLGGKNIYKLDGKKDLWYILSDSTIEHATYYFQERTYTLEEFIEKFHYKVGDKVIVKGYKQVFEILSMRWCSERNDVLHSVSNGWFYTEELQPYKEENMDEREEKAVNNVFDVEVISFDIAQKDKYELDLQGKFEVVLREGKYYVERIKPKYPNTYEECCKILQVTHTEWQGYLGEVLVPFQKLLICRNAYWMIAGGWKFDFDKPGYHLFNEYGSVQKFEGTIDCSAILSFPTKEMRDAFYENFKELIEECKEFL